MTKKAQKVFFWIGGIVTFLTLLGMVCGAFYKFGVWETRLNFHKEEISVINEKLSCGL